MGRREGGNERQPDRVARQQRKQRKRARRKGEREKRRERNASAGNGGNRPERAEDGERARDEPERQSGTGAARLERAEDGERARDEPERQSGTGAARLERAEDGERARDEPERQSGTGAARLEQQISAPSLGPNTVIEREPVEERLARHEQSNVDAMGHDKRRSVVGQSYGPSKARQLAVYLGFLAILAALVVGGIILIGSLDTSVGKNVPNSAPWAKPGAKQSNPKPIQ
jgi:hypothetical protein